MSVLLLESKTVRFDCESEDCDIDTVHTESSGWVAKGLGYENVDLGYRYLKKFSNEGCCIKDGTWFAEKENFFHNNFANVVWIRIRIEDANPDPECSNPQKMSPKNT